MPNTLFLIFMYFSEWLIVFSYAKSIYETRGKRAWIISFLLYGGLMIVYGYVINQEIVNILLTVLCNLLLLFLCFKSTFKSSFFHAIALGITQLISEVIAVYAIAFFVHLPTDAFTENETIYVIGVISSKIFYFVISRFLVKVSSKESDAKSWGRWALLSILPLGSVFVIVTIRIITNGQVLSPGESTLCLMASVLLLFVNIVIYLIYERSEKNSQKLIELEMTNQKNEIDLQYLTLLEKKNEAMKIMAHDYKRHMMTLEAMSDAPEIKSYIHEILGEVEQFSQIGKTKNKLLDVILGKYTDICREKDIRFETDIMSDNLSFIQGADISALFNNLLDNAVEAAEQSLEKYIRVEISNSLHAYHIIKIANSCDRPPNTKNGRLLTTKANQDTHGFGFKSIQKAVNNYNGELQWSYDAENKRFSLTIAIPIEQ